MLETQGKSNSNDDYIELKWIMSIVWRRKWILILFISISALMAVIASNLMMPIYEASTTLFINLAQSGDSSEYSTILASERLTRSYARILTNRPVLKETLALLNLSITVGELEKTIRVELIKDTQLIELKVQNTSPVLAANIANTIVEEFSKQSDATLASRFAASKASLEKQLGKIDEQIENTETSINNFGIPKSESGTAELERLRAELAQYQLSYTNLLQSYEEIRVEEAKTISTIIQIEPAEPSVKPVRPRKFLYTILATIVGGMIGIGIIFLVEHIDDTLKTAEDVANVLKMPVLASVADSEELKKLAQGPITISEHPLSPVTEAFRALRKNIAFANGDSGPKVIMVASPGVQEGKTTIATNLAVSIALSGKRVILVDADLRRPQVHHLLGIPNKLGLSDVLQNHRKINDVAQRWKNGHLVVVTGGSLIENPTEVLDSGRMVQVLAGLRNSADTVIIDSSPFFISDAWSLVTKVDRLLIVIASGKTTARAALDMFKQLSRAGAKEVSIVLNSVTPDRAHYYGSYQYYSSHSGEADP